MKRTKQFKKQYEALGFVEALMAIMVVGISSIVLMQIAVNTMRNTIQNETIDNMTQYAVEGAGIVQELANKQASVDEEIFPPVDDWGQCFVFAKDEGEYVLSMGVGFNLNTDRALYKEAGVLEDEEEDESIVKERLFRIVCFEEAIPGDEDPSFVVVTVVVGQPTSDGETTRGSFVRDYSYLTVVKL